MFDTKTTLTIGPLRTAAGAAEVTVRWPTDEEWTAHRKRRKIFRRDLGRGAHESEIESGDADAKLYEAIKLNGAPPLTVAEASFIIDQIAMCNVLGVDLAADQAEVRMQTVMGEVKHTVRIPTIDQVKTLERSSRYINLPFNLSEIRTNLAASVGLWEKCEGSVDGYAGEAPNVHKDVAIRSVIDKVNQEVAPRHDESNF